MSDNDDQNIYAMINFPVRMRTAPTGIDQSGSGCEIIELDETPQGL